MNGLEFLDADLGNLITELDGHTLPDTPAAIVDHLFCKEEVIRGFYEESGADRGQVDKVVLRFRAQMLGNPVVANAFRTIASP